MNEIGENIYKNARLRSGLKREPAAEELHIDVRTLDKYESFNGKAPDDVVKNMCILYCNHYLAYQHMKKSPLGEFLPELTEESFKGATLSMVNNFYDLEIALKGIIRIASDGIVNENEKEEWEQHKTELKNLASSILALLLSIN